MKNQTIFVIAFLIIFAACKTWDSEIQYTTDGLLTKIEDGDNEIIAEYTYNKNGLLKDSWYHTDYYMSGENEEFTYTFNSNKLLIKKEGFEPGNMIMSSMVGAADKYINFTFKYDSEERISTINANYHFEENDDMDFETLLQFEYPDNKTVVATSNIINELANGVTSGTEFHYNNNGNIEKKLNFYYENNTKRINSKEEFTYDNKNIPIDFNPGPKSKNNVLTKIITAYNYDEQENQSEAYISSYTYEYEYNQQGYPVKMTETWPNKIQNIKFYYY